MNADSSEIWAIIASVLALLATRLIDRYLPGKSAEKKAEETTDE